MPLVGTALLSIVWLLLGSAAAAQAPARACRTLEPADLRLARCRDLQTHRPFAFDVDEKGVLWQGCSEVLMAYDSRAGETRTFSPPELKGRSISSVLCFRGRVVVVHQLCDHVTIFDPLRAACSSLPLPGTGTNIWFGTVANGKLLLFDRSDHGGVLFLDSLSGPFRKLLAQLRRYPWVGSSLPDGRVLVKTEPEITLQILDPQREELVEEIAVPYPGATISGSFFHDGVLYAADSSAGRLLVYDFKDSRWLPPIPTPDHGSLYGYIGGGFQWGAQGYFCLSTYRFASRIDNATGNLLVPPTADLGVDGRPPRFLDRFLRFDAETRRFGYLIAPAQSDGIPSICYSLARGDQVFITGYLIPRDATGSLGPAASAGDWLVWHRSAGK